MSFKKKKNKRFDKPKQPIRKDKLMMHIDSIDECIKQASEYVKNMPGCTLKEAQTASDKVMVLYKALETLEDQLDEIEDGFYREGFK